MESAIGQPDQYSVDRLLTLSDSHFEGISGPTLSFDDMMVGMKADMMADMVAGHPLA